MARIRSIKPEFQQPDAIGRVSRDARLLLIELWPICDDHGRARGASRLLASLLFPHDDDARELIEGWLGELEAEGHIRRYVVDGEPFVECCNWLKDQKIDKPSKPIYPSPREEDASPREPSRILPLGREGKGREQGEEGKGTGKTPSSSSVQAPTTGESKPVDIEKHRAERKAARLVQITDEAITAYNAILGKPVGLLAAVNAKVGKERRRKEVARCLKVASEICQEQYGDKHVTPKFWEDYFAEVDRDPFRSGRQAGSGEHANWKPDFEYLTREPTMLKVFEKSEAAA